MSPARKVAACGTYSGYVKHIRMKTETCAECRAARNKYARSRDRGDDPQTWKRASKLDPIEHGTYNGYRREERRGEVCEECAPFKSTPRIPAACGTRSGYNRHLYNKEKPCAPCTRASSDYKAAAYHKNHPDAVYYKKREAKAV